MTRKKKTSDKFVKQEEPKVTKLDLPYATTEQNIIWYLRLSKVSVRYTDLKRNNPALRTFDDWKKFIDNL